MLLQFEFCSKYFEEVLVDDGCGTSGAKKRRLMIGLHTNVMIIVIVGYLITSLLIGSWTMVNSGSTIILMLYTSIIHHGSHVTNLVTK